MEIEFIPLDALKEDKIYIKAIGLIRGMKVDYSTAKHISFSVQGDENVHNVMYFTEKPASKKWQCDCKWYTLQNKTCSHIIAVNLAIKKKLIKLEGED